MEGVWGGWQWDWGVSVWRGLLCFFSEDGGMERANLLFCLGEKKEK
jgi:hypothetical protein